MNRDKYFYLGKVLRPKGFKGHLRIILDVDNPGDYGGLGTVFLERKREMIPMFIDELILEENRAAVKFRDVDDEEAATRLQGCKLFLPAEILPPLEGNRFYYHEVTGFEVIDAIHGSIGTIKGIIELPSNPLFEIDHQGKEILVPVQDNIIRDVDREKRRITIAAPEGLIDLYLE